MEEIYIVKLKGLPPPRLGSSQESLSKDSKTSFYYHTDLTAEAIRGFSFLHIFFGLTVLCLSVTNLCFHENPLSLEPPLGITVWCAIAFIILGFFGLVTAYKRKCDLSGSIFYVKIHFVIIVVVLSMTLTFIILFAFDLHGPIANQFIGLNIFFSIIVETVILLITLFTCARVLWPGCMNFCAKDWPMQPKLKRKVIVKTNVFANGIQQDESGTIQSVGPNCVISLNMPPLSSDQTPSASPDPSSTPTPTKEISNSILSSVLYSATSDLTNSSSSLCSVGGTQVPLSGGELSGDSSPTASSQPIYHSSLGLANSYPLSSGSSMQTFPHDSPSRINHSNIYGQVNRLLYQNSHLFKRRLLAADATCDSGQEGPLPSRYSTVEELDPYDTDEFDYCSTEDEDERGGRGESADCRRSSSDEGNATLEEDNKSSVNSEQLSTSHSENDLNSTECLFPRTTISDSDTDLRFEVQTFEQKTSVVLKHESFKQAQSKLSADSHYRDIAHIEEAVDGGGGLVDSTDRASLHEAEDEDDERDEGISSSGSSTCSSDMGAHFANRLRLQTFRSKSSNFKSSIKIEAKNTHLSLPSSSSEIPAASTEDSPEVGVSNGDFKTDSPTTIRLLTTKSSTTQSKQKLRIDFTDDKSSIVQLPSPSNAAGSNKLASHPYLCRLRASNADCFERRYPKYVSSASLPPPGPSPTDNRPLSNLSVKYQEPNRIPDIQRV